MGFSLVIFYVLQFGSFDGGALGFSRVDRVICVLLGWCYVLSMVLGFGY